MVIISFVISLISHHRNEGQVIVVHLATIGSVLYVTWTLRHFVNALDKVRKSAHVNRHAALDGEKADRTALGGFGQIRGESVQKLHTSSRSAESLLSVAVQILKVFNL
ncbi:MAG: hypothetical protein ABJ310_21525, partial [Roseobacter sp.]